MVSFIKPSAAANMKQYLMPSYGEIMKHALTCKAIGAEVCSSVWCEFVLVKVNMNQLGVILYLNMYVCKFEPIQHVFRQKAFCKESILFHSYTLFYSLQRGQGIFIAINYTHVFSGDPNDQMTTTAGTISKSADKLSVTIDGINSKSFTLANEHTAISGGTQLRIVSMTITYAE